MIRSRDIADNIVNGNLSDARAQLLGERTHRNTVLLVCNVIDDLSVHAAAEVGFRDYYHAVGQVRRLMQGADHGH